MNDFTIQNYSEILKLENQILNAISTEGMRSEGIKIPKPGRRAIENILAYSKTVSFRDSNRLGSLKMMLN